MADSFITAVLQSDLTSSRYLTATAGSGILLQDNGALQPFNITTTGVLNSIATQSGSSGYLISNGNGTASVRSFANSASITVTNATGVIGQTSFAVVNNSSIQNITTQVNGGSTTTPRSTLNFLTIGGVGVSTVDNAGNQSTDITLSFSGGGGGGAPANATYWVSTANGTLTNEVNLGALTAGVLGITVTSGVATPYIVTQIIDANITSNLFVGTGAGTALAFVGQNNLIVGRNAGSNIAVGTSSYNAILGDSAASNISGNYNSVLGYGAGVNLGGNYNTIAGSNAGIAQLNYTHCTFLGFGADASVNNLTGATAIGAGAIVSTSNTMAIGAPYVVIGDTGTPLSPGALNILPTNGSATLYFGSRGSSPTPNATGGFVWVDNSNNLNYTNNATTYPLTPGGNAPTNATYWVSTANGTLTNEVNLGLLTSGVVGITVSAGVATPYIVTQIYEDTSLTNLFIGTGAGNPLHPTNTNNLGIGSGSLVALTTGIANVAVGSSSGSAITTGSTNTAVGVAAFNVATDVHGSVALGYESGSSQTTYTDCTFLGANSDANVNGLTNATAIGYNARISTSNTMVLGQNNAIVIGDTTGPTNMAGLNMMTANNTPTIYVSATSTTPTANTTGGTLWVDSSNQLSYMNTNAASKVAVASIGGSAATCGIGVLGGVGSIVIISTTAVTANSIILTQLIGSLAYSLGVLTGSTVPGTSFAVNINGGAAPGTSFFWFLVNPV